MSANLFYKIPFPTNPGRSALFFTLQLTAKFSFLQQSLVARSKLLKTCSLLSTALQLLRSDKTRMLLALSVSFFFSHNLQNHFLELDGTKLNFQADLTLLDRVFEILSIYINVLVKSSTITHRQHSQFKTFTIDFVVLLFFLT